MALNQPSKKRSRKRRTAPVVVQQTHNQQHSWGTSPLLGVALGVPFALTRAGIGLLIDSLRITAGYLDEQVSNLLRQDPRSRHEFAEGFPIAKRAATLREIADILTEASNVRVEFPGEAA